MICNLNLKLSILIYLLQVRGLHRSESDSHQFNSKTSLPPEVDVGTLQYTIENNIMTITFASLPHTPTVSQILYTQVLISAHSHF